MDTDNEYVKKEPCPECGSKDNLARYSDGHAWCFGCNYRESGEGGNVVTGSKKTQRNDAVEVYGDLSGIKSRGITEETCTKWGYRIGHYKGKPCHFAYYYDPSTRERVACKLRFKGKEFPILGAAKKRSMYGQWLWRDGGKRLTITEGEIDALSISQLQSNKWPVVSVIDGAQGAANCIRDNIDWINKFESIIFMFDMDEPGRKAAIECAKIIQPGRAFIANLPLKDANEMLLAGRGGEVIDAMWGAKAYRPDGVIAAKDLWDIVSSNEDKVSYSYPFEGLNEKTHGIRKRELVTITAGSGVGKTAFIRECAYHLLEEHKLKVGLIMLEENPKRTMEGLLGIHLNKTLHLSANVNTEELAVAFDELTRSNNLFLYDSFGSIESGHLLDRVRYLATGLQCDVIILDHISIAISGLETHDERKAIDVLMTRLRSLVEETGIGLIIVSHLRRSQGDKGYEEGLQTSLNALRGSQAIAQLSDMVIALERDQQGTDSNITTVRVLKNRFSGETGEATHLEYFSKTGRLKDGEFNPFSVVAEDEAGGDELF